MAIQDPYATLGVKKTATQEEIKNAYRNLAKKFHPDLNPGNKKAEARFKEISVAYDLIGTEESRAKFERGEAEHQQDASSGFSGRGGPFYSWTQSNDEGEGGRYSHRSAAGFDEDFFESLFRSARGRADDRLYEMEIDLKDSVLGAEKEIVLPHGKRLSVKIPAGVTSGSRLRFKGQASDGGRYSTGGDVYVEIRVRPDPRFKIDGSDLIYELPVSIADALFGAQIRVPTLDREVALTVPPSSNTDTKLRLKGQGLFNRQTHQRGDQIVVLKVRLPERIDPELRDALLAWRNRQGQERGGQG